MSYTLNYEYDYQKRSYKITGYTGEPVDVIIPESSNVYKIETGAFADCTTLKSIVIPNSVEEIGIGAFENCSNLSSLSIPFVGVTRTETGPYRVFGSIFGQYETNNTGICPSGYVLQSQITNSYYYYPIPSSVRQVVITDVSSGIPEGAFRNCTYLARVIIEGDKCYELGESSFSGCVNLKEIILPSNLSLIRQEAFKNCSGLTKIKIPTSVSSIEAYAFTACSNLTAISFSPGIMSIGKDVLSACTSLTDLTISYFPENRIQSFFGDSSTEILKNLKKVIITPSSAVSQIPYYAFNQCTNLTDVILGEGITELGDYAFSGCSSLTNVQLPNSLTTIGMASFENCSSLSQIKIPHNVKTIDTIAFAGCTSLTNIELGDKIESISSAAFYNCAIETIDLPRYLTTISAQLFENCSKLKILYLPEYINKIEVGAFKNTQLNKVYLKSAIPPELEYIPDMIIFVCNSTCFERYKSANNWIDIAEQGRLTADDLSIHFIENARAQKKYFANKGELSNTFADVNVEKGLGAESLQQVPRASKINKIDVNGDLGFEFQGHSYLNNISEARGFVKYGAVGPNSTSLGGRSSAQGSHSMAVNSQTLAKGDESFASGYCSAAIGGASFASGSNTAAIGETSHTEGEKTLALGKTAHAEGTLTQAKENYSHAEGYESISAGMAAHSEGYMTEASHKAAHAEGQETVAEGLASHAEGVSTRTEGSASHAEGTSTKAIGPYSHSEGSGTNATGESSHAEGIDTQAHTSASHTEGANTQVINLISYSTAGGGSSSTPSTNIMTAGNAACGHAEGNSTIVMGYAAHAEGVGTKAYGHASHAEGFGSQTGTRTLSSSENGVYFDRGAGGSYAHAEGYMTQALGNYSHAGGQNTYAGSDCQTVIGHFNKNLSDNLFEIGNGTGVKNDINELRNAFEVTRSGIARILGTPNDDQDLATIKWVKDHTSNIDLSSYIQEPSTISAITRLCVIEPLQTASDWINATPEPVSGTIPLRDPTGGIKVSTTFASLDTYHVINKSHLEQYAQPKLTPGTNININNNVISVNTSALFDFDPNTGVLTLNI